MESKADYPLYYYYPSLAAAILFVVFFAIVSVAHLGQTIFYRNWWTIIIPIGTALELVGYSMYVSSRQKTYLTGPGAFTVTTTHICGTNTW